MHHSSRTMGGLVVAAFLTIAAVRLGASGFSILEQSTAGLGRSLAGMASDIYEPSALFFNPSLSAWHDTPALSLGGNWLHVNANCEKNSTSTGRGRDSGDGGGWCHVPNFDLVYPISNDISLGLAFSATSGTATKWNPRWIGRYESIDTEIAVVEATPSIAWKLRDNLSIGAGVVLQYAQCEMSRAIPLSFSAGGSRFSFPDGKLKLKGDSFALGAILGVSYRPWEHTRLGLSYRTALTQKLALDGDFRASKEFSATTGYPRSYKGDADCDLKLPSVITFSVAQDVSDRLTFMADVSWTRASVFKELAVKFDRKSSLGQFIQNATGSTSSTNVMKWRDTWRFCAGGEYKLTDKWTLRAGTAYDLCPFRSEEFRDSSLPDLNRIWLSGGISYQWNKQLRFDLGYVHIFFLEDRMKFNTPDGGRACLDVTGDTDVFSYAITYTF